MERQALCSPQLSPLHRLLHQPLQPPQPLHLPQRDEEVHHEGEVQCEGEDQHEVVHHEVDPMQREVSRRDQSSTPLLHSHLQQHEVCEVHRLVFQHPAVDVMLDPVSRLHHGTMEASDHG